MKPNDFSLITPTDTTEIYTQTDDKTGKFTLEDLKAYLEASEWTEVIINISSAQIISMGSSPIQLLPNAGLNKYYIFEGILEFIGTDNQYSIPDSISAIRIYYDQSFNGAGCYFDKFFLSSKGSSVIPFNSIPNVGTNKTQNGIGLNSSIFLSTDRGGNPTYKEGGKQEPGTIRIVLKYKIKTFGA
jgi:hypothetical protein